MRLAYLILAHHKLNVLERLIHSIYSSDNLYMIHIDAKADVSLHRFVHQLAELNENIKVLPSRYATWSCWSLVQVELDGIKELLKEEWDNYILLSGQDFPAATQSEIERTLAPYLGKNFMRVASMSEEEVALRTHHYYVEDCSTMKILGDRKPFEDYFANGYQLFTGAQWKVLHRSFCEYAVTSPSAFDMQDYFRYTLIPDEMYFSTMIMNSPFKESLINNMLRFYVMDESVNGFRRAADLTVELLDTINLDDPANPVFFVRKVNDENSEVMDLLEARLEKKLRTV